ncbi:MAG: hypothetical protein HUJ95_04770, partial [Bacteroidales bacterium]|nr:hypothetical protein [Bacteroidales bacterium]
PCGELTGTEPTPAPTPTPGEQAYDIVTHAIPTGGTEGQVLAKRSDADRDTYWKTVSGGGGGGTSDHRELEHRDAAEQHPISAITNLTEQLESLSTSISAESTTRADADTQLAQGINNEASIRAQADETLVGYIDTLDGKLTTEKQQRENADSALNEGKQNKADPTLTTTDKTIVGAINELQNSKQNKVDESLETVSTSIVGAINEVRSDLVQEGQMRVQADAVIMDDLDTKVDKVAAQSGNPFVYGRMSIEDGGAEGKFTMSSAVTNGAVVKRAGQQIKGVTPVSNDDLAIKSYVDSGDAVAKQYVKQDSTTIAYFAPILFKANDSTASATGQVYFNDKIRANPSTGEFKATAYIENGTTLSAKYASKTDIATLSSYVDTQDTATLNNAKAWVQEQGYLTLETLPRYNGEVQ